jgi:hypothetical protein
MLKLKHSKFLLYVIAFIALGIVGYGGSRLIAIGFLPHIRHHVGSYVAMTTFMMLAALSVPYGVLKLLGYATPTVPQGARVLEFKALPKKKAPLTKPKRQKSKQSKSKR